MKCKIEQKNIVFYVMLIERIEQIKRAMFEVEWRKSLTTKKKKNPFHIYLMEEVQK